MTVFGRVPAGWCSTRITSIICGPSRSTSVTNRPRLPPK